MKTLTKLQKRKTAKVNKELQALNALRTNGDIHDAIAAWIVQPHLTIQQVERLRAVQAVLCCAPLNKKLLAEL